MSEARKGKIARCPLAIREEVNRRLADGQPASKILAWLNAQEEVLAVLDEYFHEEPISPQNLSEWRQGGYEEWRQRRESLELQKELNTYAGELAARGRDLGPGNVAIVGGQLSQILSSLDVEQQKELLKAKPATYIALLDGLARIEKSQADRIKAEAGRDMVGIQRRRAEQAEEKLKLEVQKFARQTAELFLKFYEDKRAKEIVERKGPRTEQIEKLRQLMFPDLEPLDPTPLNPDRKPKS